MFIDHRVVETEGGFELILYLDPMLTEFSEELGRRGRRKRNRSLRENAVEYIREKIPGLNAKRIKVMLGAVLVTTLALSGPIPQKAEAYSAASVQKSTQQSVNVTINGSYLHLSSPAVNRSGTVYVPAREIANALGGTVWWNGSSKTVGINKGSTKIAFVIGARTARVNGRSVGMPPSYIINGVTMVPVRFLTEALGQSVSWNGATRTVNISNSEQNSPAPNTNTVSYQEYTVKSGDTIWDLSIKFGLPQAELLKVNGLTMNSHLYIGQKLTIPVHHIAVQATVSERHGEYLDWWTEAQYVFPINKVATVTDFRTGRSFQIKRTIGANHADCEPLTANDASIIKQIWGGSYSWAERAVIVSVDGRKIAASMSSMPHDIDYIKNNNFNGHFDLHFKNSTRHYDGAMTPAHQQQVRIAAGLA
ncbi:MAG: stalk domain-containing protein [Eubacteriales bacterium]|jgi:LysM repeat protein